MLDAGSRMPYGNPAAEKNLKLLYSLLTWTVNERAAIITLVKEVDEKTVFTVQVDHTRIDARIGGFVAQLRSTDRNRTGHAKATLTGLGAVAEQPVATDRVVGKCDVHAEPPDAAVVGA